MNPECPKLYGLIKLHKDQRPIKPVCLAKKLCSIIKNYSNFKSIYGISNSISFANDISKLEIKSTYKLVSFDVSNLYGSVPTGVLPGLVKGLLQRNKVLPAIIQE